MITAASILLVCNGAVDALQSDPAGISTNSAPRSTEGGNPGGSTAATAQNETSRTAPPVIPLSGADVPTPRSGGGGRSYLVTSLGWTGYADTSPFGVAGSKIFAQSTYLGSLDLQRIRKHGQLNLDYAGGAFFYSRRLAATPNFNPPTNGTFQSLGLRQTITWRRWEVDFEDQALYLPESSFGFGGFGGLGTFGLGLGGNYLGTAPQLNPALEPNQTILNGSASRLSNVAVTQVQYTASGRSAMTATGLYGVLHFQGGGFNSNYWGLLAGYDHALTPRNTVAINYAHYLIRFDGAGREILDRGFELLYGRRITGQLALTLSGGPMASQIALPFGGAITRSFWNTYDSLQYSYRKGHLETSFLRYTTAGAGVLLGAESDVARFSAARRLTRRISGSLEFGHSYNQSLTGETALHRRSKYETWEAGASVSRQLGESVSFYLDYRFARQISNNPVCIGAICTPVVRRHVGGIGLNWHSRPIKIG